MAANDVTRRRNAPRPLLLHPRAILRLRDAFVTNFTAAEFRALRWNDRVHQRSAAPRRRLLVNGAGDRAR
ncbi:hypothetical protein EVAR_73812_1 [Eumeta japonica]|uniref:Uncharacterized protein n=1 Tax=Eumeta variegata TaxID=151549 RepID=A0A4C1TAY9_EUMVA|nr:hypothetical protein EVAR_73812_1 [Eumeta japonica]